MQAKYFGQRVFISRAEKVKPKEWDFHRMARLKKIRSCWSQRQSTDGINGRHRAGAAALK